jgi:hypothetical protein
MEPEIAELKGRARSLANLRRYPKGTTGNRNGRRGHGKPLERQVDEIMEEAIEHAETVLIEDVRAVAKLRTDKALRTLERALDAPSCPWSTRVTAAQALLDRGWGRATEAVKAEVGFDLAELLRRGRDRWEEVER